MVYEHPLPHSIVKAAAEGRRVFVHFDAVNSYAEIFVNKQRVGHHAGGYTAFAFDITRFLKDGNNTLTVLASNAYRTDVAPLAGDFNIYGGITRPVSLIVTNSRCISPVDCASSGVYVHQKKIDRDLAEICIETVIYAPDETAAASLSDNPASLQSHNLKGLTLKATISDADGNVVYEGSRAVESANSMHDITISKPKLWDGRGKAHQYTVCIELSDGQQVIDKVTEQTGLRSFSVDAERGFYLNGRYLDLYGPCRHEEGYGTAGLYNEEAMSRDADIIDNLGATGVRFVHYPHSRYDVRMYDERGIVVWYELNLAGPGGYASPGYISNPELERNVMQNLEEMIKQNYNAPSICFWSLCNELSFKYDEPATFLRRLHLRAKQLDPQRQTTLAICYDQDRFQHITDLIGWNKYFGWYNPDGSIGEFMDEAHRLAAHQPIGLCEYGAAASINQHSFEQKVSNRIHYEEYQARVHEDHLMQMRKRPYSWCKFIWQYADNPSSIRDEGDRRGMNDKGIVTYDRSVMKDAYYFYKANWNPEPMLYIAARRYTQRTEKHTDVKVYTNQPSATLYLNGKRVGRARNDGMGRIVFNGVSLKPGENLVEVKAGKLSDSCSWTLDENKTKNNAAHSDQKLDGSV